jgi:hypothetical protein
MTKGTQRQRAIARAAAMAFIALATACSDLESAAPTPNPSRDGGEDASTDASTDGRTPVGGAVSCTSEGAQRCASLELGAREVCVDGRWQAMSGCAEGELCRVEDEAAICSTTDEACVGHANENVCVGSALVSCGSSSATSQIACESSRHCEAAREEGACAVCLEGEHRCVEEALQRCNDEGRGWVLVETCETEALCNASAKACTAAACVEGVAHCDGDTLQHCSEDRSAFEDVEICNADLCDEESDECDVCLPESKRCEGDVAMTCANDGQSEVPQQCPERCAGSGTCVECIDAEDCDAPTNACEMAVCSPEGTCSAINRAANDACPAGACDGAGNCVCDDHDDCPGALNVCLASGTCAENTCGDGVVAGSEECDDDNSTTTDACADCQVAECGDGYVQSGVEECDPNASGWSTTTCDDDDCEIRVYVRCNGSDNPCESYGCNVGGCAPSCAQPCPTVPGWPIAGCGFHNGCQLRCVDGDCPFGMVCLDFGAGLMCGYQ